MTKLINFLSEQDIRTLEESFAKTEWKDGAATASGSAKARKKNWQITETDTEVSPVFRKLKQFMMDHDALKFMVFPHKIINIRAAKYTLGDGYGWHVDHATMGGYRSDISFTIFLSEKSGYEGGELEFDFGTHKMRVKGEKGQMVFYPTGVLHRVSPVIKGERVVIVGWIQSLISVAEDRDQLATLIGETYRLRHKFCPDPTDQNVDALNRAVQHMIRRFSV